MYVYEYRQVYTQPAICEGLKGSIGPPPKLGVPVLHVKMSAFAGQNPPQMHSHLKHPKFLTWKQ